MSRLKPNNPSKKMRLSKDTINGTLKSSHSRFIRHKNELTPSNLIRNLTFDEMIEASSLFDSLINGASEVNQSSVSPNARKLVKLTHTKYPKYITSVYKNLNKRIVDTNYQLYSSDPGSEALYLQLMGSTTRYSDDIKTNISTVVPVE